MFKKIMESVMTKCFILLTVLAVPLAARAAECSCPGCAKRIEALEKRVAELERRIAALPPSPDAAKSVWPQNSFNYLAIGNSITMHGICKYWWNRVGMAASDAEHDYFNLVTRGLSERHDKVTARTFNFSIWERTGHDRDQTFADLDKLLDDRVSLVTIQLGENVRDRSTFAEDYVSLIEHIRQKTGGKAQIIVIGDFWSDDPVRPAAAKKCGVDYVSLKATHDDPKDRSRIGAIVYDAKGKPHTVNHKGVAKHPSDEGMAFIAAGVLKKVK